MSGDVILSLHYKEKKGGIRLYNDYILAKMNDIVT